MSQLDHWQVPNSVEKQDVMGKTGLKWVLWFAVYVVIVSGLSIGAYAWLTPRAFQGPYPRSEEAAMAEHPLQSNQQARYDIARLRQHEDFVLSSSGASLYHLGARRMPIEQAIDQIASRGLPRHPFKPGSYRLAPSAAEARP